MLFASLRLRRAWIAPAGALALAAGPATAQDASGEAAFPLRVERIIVTTQKREEDAFEVPITLTAFSPLKLDTLSIDDFEELSTYTPGLQVQLQSPNNPAFVIRGITSDNGNFQDPPRVSVYYNGVDVSRARGSAFELFDLERVEIAKGPQATLFGTAASIGAVSVITARPEPGFFGEAYISGGSYNAVTAGGFVTGGTDLVQARLAGQVRRRDGYVTNLAGSQASNSFSAQEDLNGVETIAVRPSLRFTPSPDLTLDAVFTYERNTPPGTAFVSGRISPTAGLQDGVNVFEAADLSGAFGQPSLLRFDGFGPTGPMLAPVGDDTIAAHLGGDALGLEREVYDINLTARWDINEAFALTAIAAYREFDSLEVFDADGSQVPLVEASEDTEGDQTSFELRVNYDRGGRFRGFAGVNYFQEEGFQRAPFALDETLVGACLDATLQITPVCLNPDGSFNRVNIDPATAALAPLVPAALAPGIYYPAEFTNTGDHETISIFADLTFDVTPRLSVTGGVRFADEERASGLRTVFPASFLIASQAAAMLPDPALALDPAFLQNPALVLFPGFVNTNNELVSASLEDDAVLPRANVLFAASDDLSLYATVSKGRRSPVFSITQTDDPATDIVDVSQEIVPEETVWNYEIGFKSLLFGNRAQIDAAVFVQDYEDFRVQLVDVAQGGITNQSAGSATNVGFELDGQVQATETLRILGTFAYLDAEIDDIAENGEFAGNQFRLTPETSGSFAVDYRRPLWDGVEAFGTVGWTYRSEVFFEADNRPIAGLDISEGDISLVNLRFGLADLDGAWRVSLYGKNIFDEEYLIDAGNTGGDFGSPTFIPGAPALWGVELRGAF